MKKIIIGCILLFLNLVLIVSGFTCLIIGYTAKTISTYTEFLLLFGWTSVGCVIGTILTVACLSLITIGIK